MISCRVTEQEEEVALERLKKQLEFIVEIDKLKHIFRQNVLIKDRRNENDAEHSWHITLMAMLLKEYYVHPDIDLLKVMKMTIVHDLVEVYAGDTFCYDEEGNMDKVAREKESAKKLFGMLPEDQEQEMWSLWWEFETQQTHEAKFGACLDRLQPLILNSRTEGHTWKKPGVNKEKVLERNAVMKDYAPRLWEYVLQELNIAVEQGYLAE
ncbi:HD domain-containing protein [Alkalibacter rhizosphaerae]|uniref:HD domain-containing protein n=1 Tax=Alkalibacter rhizosphaerae TaxID=2815577 RepID=UPI0035A89384